MINEDTSGWICDNQWGIQGSWYCYTDGSDKTNSCQGSDGKGKGAIPWNSSSGAMCMSGTTGTSGFYGGIGFKVNQATPTDPSFSTWDATSHNIVGFAITMTGTTGGSTVNLKFPATGDSDPTTQDSPSVTLPGVAGTTVTYNALFSDAVLANNSTHAFPVDPTKLTDVTVALPSDAQQHTYNFCITKVVPLTAAPSPEVPTGAYGPAWTNETAQAVNGVNGYAVQSDPFLTGGEPITMQVTGGTSAGDVGFTYKPGSNYQSNGNSPAAFPAVVSGWGPGEKGIQFYGPYKGTKTIGALKSVPTSWSFSMGGVGDAAYDVWFGPDPSQGTPAPAVELMVWINYNNKQPLGSAMGQVTIGNISYQVYSGAKNSTGQPVISYLPATGANSTPASFDLLKFFQDATSSSRGVGLSSGSYLYGVQTGFEVYSGGGTWTTTDYKIQIN